MGEDNTINRAPYIACIFPRSVNAREYSRDEQQDIYIDEIRDSLLVGGLAVPL